MVRHDHRQEERADDPADEPDSKWLLHPCFPLACRALARSSLVLPMGTIPCETGEAALLFLRNFFGVRRFAPDGKAGGVT